MGIFVIVDIGTSYIKCGCTTAENNILVEDQRKFPMQQSQDTFELNFELFFHTAKELIHTCLAEISIQDLTIEALLITSQANTFVPVDDDFKPLCNGIVWLDERAREEADYLTEQLPGYSKYSGFNKMLPGLCASKLLWLKRNKPRIFKNAQYFPLINEYLAYKLTGKFYSDSTSFGMSGLYDFHQNAINRNLLQILDLTADNFSTIESAAKKGVLISKEIMQEWNMSSGFPVFLCGNDQSASASGAGLEEVGDITINFGSAMVLFSITKNLVTNLRTDQMSGKYPIGGSYFLLGYESDFGIKIRILKEKLFKKGSYNQLFQTYLDYPEIGAGNPCFSDADLNFNSTNDACRFCASIIKHYLYQLKKHIENIEQQVNIKNIFLSGGMTKSTVWLQIIKKELEQTVTIKNQSNAGLIGALNIYLSNRAVNPHRLADRLNKIRNRPKSKY